MLPAFGHKAAIGGENAVARTRLMDQMPVELKKITRGFKMAPVRFFRIHPIASHIQKREPPRQADEYDKNVGKEFFADEVDAVHSSQNIEDACFHMTTLTRDDISGNIKIEWRVSAPILRGLRIYCMSAQRLSCYKSTMRNTALDIEGFILLKITEPLLISCQLYQ